MEIDPIRIWKLLTQPLTGRHPIRACRAQPKMWQKPYFYWFSSLFLWFLLLSTWLDNKHRNHWPLYVLASRPFSANTDKQQSISENMYLAHISRTCIPHVSIICLKQIRNKISENMYPACVSRTCIPHACTCRLCTYTSEIKSQIKIQV